LLKGLEEVKALYRAKYGRDLADYEDEGELLYDAEGTAWSVTVGRGASEQKQVYDARVAELEDSLAEVKALYFAKYGRDLEDFEDEGEPVYDAEGMAWQVSVGRGAIAQKEAYNAKLESLEDSLQEVKVLYRAKYGDDLDFDDELDSFCDADGTQWVRTAACSATVQQQAYSKKVEALDDRVAELKTLYFAKYGRDLEDYEDEQEQLYDAQGTAWSVTVGRGIVHQREAYDSRLNGLLKGLEEVKALYRAKYGRDLADYEDEGELLYDAEGTAWSVTVGRGASEQKQVYDARVAELEDSLAEVKALYFAKYGRDLEDFEDEGEFLYDSDGMAWNVSVGRGVEEQRDVYNARVDLLLENLAEVKSLYTEKYGWDVHDDDVEEGQVKHVRDADGTLWVGIGPVCAEAQKEQYFRMQAENGDALDQELVSNDLGHIFGGLLAACK